MKRTIRLGYTKVVGILLLMLTSLIGFAQDKGIDVDVNLNKESNWYQQPWVWILGGAIFILLLAAILRGGSRSKAD